VKDKVKLKRTGELVDVTIWHRDDLEFDSGSDLKQKMKNSLDRSLNELCLSYLKTNRV
jgi:hypothetical protein